MEGFPLKFRLLIRSRLSTESKIFLIMELCVIFCGLILLIKEKMAMDLRQEEQVIVGEKTSVTSLTIRTT
jgi:hypothetical protein